MSINERDFRSRQTNTYIYRINITDMK